MTDFEQHNRGAIDSLNQRGGRMLSLVDLLAAGTLNLDMAAEMAYVAAGGGSFLTAAGPGGVGKTALMGAALGFLAPGTEIVTIEGRRTLEDLGPPPDHLQCLVAHEIGAGSYYGYLWGPAVARYFEVAMAPGRSLASNLHAETYEEAVAQLTYQPLGVSHEALGWVDLLAFMTARGGKRRVSALWDTDGQTGHAMAWRWRPVEDAFEPVVPSGAAERIARRRGGMTPEAVEADLARWRAFLAHAQADGVSRMEALRDRALDTLFSKM